MKLGIENRPGSQVLRRRNITVFRVYEGFYQAALSRELPDVGKFVPAALTVRLRTGRHVVQRAPTSGVVHGRVFAHFVAPRRHRIAYGVSRYQRMAT